MAQVWRHNLVRRCHIDQKVCKPCPQIFIWQQKRGCTEQIRQNLKIDFIVYAWLVASFWHRKRVQYKKLDLKPLKPAPSIFVRQQSTRSDIRHCRFWSIFRFVDRYSKYIVTPMGQSSMRPHFQQLCRRNHIAISYTGFKKCTNVVGKKNTKTCHFEHASRVTFCVRISQIRSATVF
jgi:hypothetical protein